nr:serine/threonine-protein kinase MARK2-like [Aotus nancymaae]
MLGVIGRGAFGQVKLAQHLLTGTQVAVKIIRKTGSCVMISQREMRILKCVHHPNIIQLYEVIDTTDVCHFIMEYASGGNLHKWLSRKLVTEKEARAMFQQMLSAMQYCHRKRIAHRDLKPANILLDGEGNVKIADFGSAITYDEGQKLTTCCGTSFYMAPEVILGHGYQCPAMDVWSLGVTLYQMVSKSLPFLSVSPMGLQEKIKSGKYTCPSSFSEGLKRLMKKLLTPDPRERPTVEEIMRDPWVNDGQELPLTTYEEQIPNHPNPETIQLLVAMGFQAESVSKAIEENLFNYPMATYLILDRKKKQSTNTLQSLAPGDPTCSPSTQVSSSPVGLQRKSESFNPDPQHAPMASPTIERSISNCGDLQTLAQQALQHDPVASSIGSPIGSGGDLQTLAQQALQRDPMASSIGSPIGSGGDLQTLAQQAL